MSVSNTLLDNMLSYISDELKEQILLESIELRNRVNEAERTIYRFWKTTYPIRKAKLDYPLTKRDRHYGMHLGATFLLKLQLELRSDASVRCGRRHSYDYDNRAPRQFWFIYETKKLEEYNILCRGLSQPNWYDFFWR